MVGFVATLQFKIENSKFKNRAKMKGGDGVRGRWGEEV
jgi:hypothetical protein